MRPFDVFSRSGDTVSSVSFDGSVLPTDSFGTFVLHFCRGAGAHALFPRLFRPNKNTGGGTVHLFYPRLSWRIYNPISDVHHEFHHVYRCCRVSGVWVVRIVPRRYSFQQITDVDIVRRRPLSVGDVPLL